MYFEMNSPDSFETTNLSIIPSLEFTLRGPAVFYAEYELGVNDMSNARTMNHKFGIGLEIKAF
jgi:hypothetical protein